MARPTLAAIAAAAAVLSAVPAESTRVRRGNLRRARGAASDARPGGGEDRDREEYPARLIELAGDRRLLGASDPPQGDGRDLSACGARGYHPDMNSLSGCTNDAEYDPRWLGMPNVFHETGEACCGYFSHLKGCTVTDVCGGAETADKGADTGTADGPCPDSRWHMSRVPGEIKTCTNDGDYPVSWLDHASFFLHDTPGGCCEAFGYGEECRVRGVPCGDPAGGGPDDDDEELEEDGGGGTPCLDQRGEARRWHMSTASGEVKVCTNDEKFPDAWGRAPPGIFLFETHGDCCDKFDWSPCGRRDVCGEGQADGTHDDGAGSGDPGDGGGTGGGSGEAEPCGALGYHPDMSGQSGCTNDDNVDPKWIGMANVFHATGEACCGYFTHLKDCAVVDVCGGAGTGPAGPSGGEEKDCVTHGWHVDRNRQDGCTNDDDVDPTWLDPAIVSLMLHPTADGCCEMAFRNRPCKRYEVTGCAYVNPAGGGGAEDGRDCDLWHPDTETPGGGGCTNDGVRGGGAPSYPDSRTCCLSHRDPGDRSCRVRDACSGETSVIVATDGPSASPTEGPPECMWHPAVDGQVMTCSFSDSYPYEWKAAQLAATARNFLFATHEECCLGTYRAASCGSSFQCESEHPTPAPSGRPTNGRPTVEPTGSPTSVWYVHHTSGTCVPDYRVKKPWYITETFGRQRDCCRRAFDVAACLARLPPPPPTPTVSPAPTLPAEVHYLDPLTGLCATSERGTVKSYIQTFFDDYWSCCSHLGAGGDAKKEEACLKAGPTRGPSNTPTSSPAWASEVPSAEPTSTTSPTAYWSDSPSHDPSSSPSTSPPTTSPTTYMHGALAAFSAKPTHSPTLGDCSRAKWRTDGVGGCTNLEDGGPVWTALLFRTSFECCAHHFAGRGCVVRDGCSRLAPSVETISPLPGNEACPDHYWHTDYTGCTYSADFPSSYWDLSTKVVFDDLGDCCKELFLKRGKDCHVENYCLPRPTSSPITVEPTMSRSPTSMPVVITTSSTTTADRTTLSPDAVLVTDSEGCLQARYHITADFSMCSNSMDYPQIYLTNERLFFFDDAASCCEASFNYEDCPVEDICDDPALASSSTTTAKNEESTTNLPHLETDGCQKWHISAIDFSKCTNDSEYLPQWLEDPELYFFDDASKCCLFAFGTSSCPKEDACSAASTNPTTVSITATTLATTLPHFETADGCLFSKWHISLDFTKCTNDLEYQRQWLENPDLYFFNDASDCCMFAFNNPECNQEQVCLTDESLEAGARSEAGECEGLGKKQCNKAKTCEFNVVSGSCDPIESAGFDAVEGEKPAAAATTTVPHRVCQGLGKKQCNKSETCEFNVGSGSCDPIESAGFDAVEGEKPAAAATTTVPPESAAAAATTTVPPESAAGVCEGLNKKKCNKAETCEFNDGSRSCGPIEHADVPNVSMCPSTTKKCKKSEHCYWTGTACVPL